MNDAAFYDETPRLFLLCSIELCAAVFRGLSAADCLHLCEEGLADLRPLYKQDKGGLHALAQATEALEDLAATHSENRHAFCGHCSTEYVRLFVTNRDGIPAPLYASCYQEGTSERPGKTVMGSPALAMRERLAAAGLQAVGNGNEPPDHISTQLEYLYFLLSTGWRDGDAASLANAARFVCDDMLGWCEPFTSAVSKHDACGLYAGTADMLMILLHLVAE